MGLMSLTVSIDILAIALGIVGVIRLRQERRNAIPEEWRTVCEEILNSKLLDGDQVRFQELLEKRRNLAKEFRERGGDVGELNFRKLYGERWALCLRQEKFRVELRKFVPTS